MSTSAEAGEDRASAVSKRRLGYLIWGIGTVVIGVPELIATFHQSALPFTTISTMLGHLEYLWSPTELFVIAAIVFPLFSLLKVSQPEEEVVAESQPTRSPGGRLTRPGASFQTREQFDAESAPRWFALAAPLSALVVTGATLAAIEWWGDGRHFHAAYVLYGSLALPWLVVPSVYAFISQKDAPFPTLFRTVRNLEDFLRARPWRVWSIPVGAVLAWLVSFLIVWGLVVLLLHITLFPFPDITHILNPNG